MANDMVFHLTPTQEDFVCAEEELCIFKGPMGEGKTFAGVMALIYHAKRSGRSIRAALIRDTHKNIELSTIPDMTEYLGNAVSFHDDNTVARIDCNPPVELLMFGIDDKASMSKLQGPQLACIWMEEPAPIYERSNAGLPKEVLNFALARASRQRGTKMRVQITQNPADEDHWTEEVAAGPYVYEEDKETGVQIRKRVFEAKYGENKYLPDIARAANKAAFKDDPGLYARYVEGRAAPVRLGTSVCKGYNPDIHFSKTELQVVKGATGLRLYDAWHNPVCLIGQWVPPGRILIHEAIQDANIGLIDLIDEQVIPRLSSSKYRGIEQWRDIGDPTMRTPDQSTVTRSTAKLLEEKLKTRFEPGPTKWEHRIQPVYAALSGLATNGLPKICISSTAYPLHRSLNGGWHWKTDNNKKVIGNVPVDDKHSHLGNALAYGVSVLFSSVRKTVKPAKSPKYRKIAASYGSAAKKTGTYGR